MGWETEKQDLRMAEFRAWARVKDVVVLGTRKTDMMGLVMSGLEHLSYEERLRKVGDETVQPGGNRRFLLNMREHFCTVQVTEHWHGLLREVVKSPPWTSSQAAWTQAWTNCSECHCLSRSVRPDHHQRFLPTSVNSVIL